MLARILDGEVVRVSTDGPEAVAAIGAGTKVWVDLERRTDETDELLVKLGVHPLTVEDIWSSGAQPKVDAYPGYLYVVVHGISSAKDAELRLVEVDVVIGPTWIVTHDRDGLVTDDIGTELDHSPRVLRKGTPWLAHLILDRLVDRYLPIVHQLDAEIDSLETDVLEKAGTPSGKSVLTRILQFKRTLQTLRRTSIHQREILLRLSRGEYTEIPPDALPFFRDVYDHFLRIQDVTDSYRDLVSACLDAYLSVQSNRMNEVMKTLTLVSTVMLPITFIAGIYGMNFDNMPELKWFLGYPFALGLMVLVAASIVLWFYYKGYIGKRDERGARRQPSRKRAHKPPKAALPER